jgi:hypothetical protein
MQRPRLELGCCAANARNALKASFMTSAQSGPVQHEAG